MIGNYCTMGNGFHGGNMKVKNGYTVVRSVVSSTKGRYERE